MINITDNDSHYQQGFNKLISSSKRNLCPICQKDHGCKVGDNLVICLRADQNWNVGGWRYIKQARNGMGSTWVACNSQTEQDRQWQREQRQRQQEEKKQQERQHKASALSNEQLDREARKLLEQLGLSTRHRQSLLNRGFSEADIEKLGFKSVERYQRLHYSISPNFPGINSTGDKLLVNGDGYLIPIFNDELIIGFQVAPDNRENGNKYKHLLRPRLKNGELPLQFYKGGNSKDLDIIEGTQKPIVAATLHGLTVLGCGGVIWASSPEQLNQILERFQPERNIINPDAGSLLNPQVLGRYRALYHLLKSLGLTLLARDWGQGRILKKDGGKDVDEIDSETFNNASIVPFEEWDKDCDDIEVEESSQNKIISSEQWFNRFKLPRLQEELGATIKRLFPKRSKPQPVKVKFQPVPPTSQPEQPQSRAIVLWKPQPITSLPYIPGELPEFEEWQTLGCPVFLIQPGERLQFYSEAYHKGYQFLKDSTPTGHGKSYDAGLINLKTFGIDPNDTEDKSRIFYLSSDHRNPTNKTIEENFTDLEARHDGLTYDYSRKTALDKPFVTRATGKHSDIPTNCPENKTFLTVAELGLHVFGGQESPICQTCPRLKEGCHFLQSRIDTLSNKRLIRADINSIPTPSQDDIVIVEESSVNIKNTHQITVSIGEIERTAGKLQLREDKRIFKALRPILEKVYRTLQRVTTDKHKYGISHQEVMAALPSIEELNAIIWELYAKDWMNKKTKDVWGRAVWDYEMRDGVEVESGIAFYEPIAPSLQDLRNECYKILGKYDQYINSWQTPEQKQEAIKNNILPPWLPVLIDCLTGNKKISLRVENGKLTITRLAKRHRNIIKNAGFAIALDATQSKEDYALSLGISPSQILEVKEVAKPVSNFHIHIITGLGKGGKQRRETQQERIKIAATAIAQKHNGQRVGLIDHKSAIGNYKDLAQSLKLGYWHHDTRGSNQFLNTEALISVGRPCPNLGQVAGEYQVLTGWAVAPDKIFGQYGAWVNRKINAELIQNCGRLRAHLRLDEQLHSYLIADLDEKAISAIRLAYPTATVTVEDVYDYAPEAATKGVQTTRGIFEAVWSALLKTGAIPSIDQIAEKMGLTKGGVSKSLKDRLGIGYRALIESLLLLYRAINSKSKLSDLDETALYIAKEYLPIILEDFNKGGIDAGDVVAEIVTTVKAYGKDILTAVPRPTLFRLLTAVLTLLPTKIKQEITEFIPPPKYQPAIG